MYFTRLSERNHQLPAESNCVRYGWFRIQDLSLCHTHVFSTIFNPSKTVDLTNIPMLLFFPSSLRYGGSSSNAKESYLLLHFSISMLQPLYACKCKSGS